MASTARSTPTGEQQYHDHDQQREQPEKPQLSFWSDTTEGSTFQSEKLKHWTESHLEDAERILNPCAGIAELDVDGEVLRVDINDDANADLHIDFRELPKYVNDSSFDAIVYDPPYSGHQCRTKYGLDISDEEFYFYDEEIKTLFDRLLKPGGVFVQFGYTTEAMPAAFGYETISVGLFNKLGMQNDYLGVAARKPTGTATQSPPLAVSEILRQNDGADDIETETNISTGGNGGRAIELSYVRSDTGTDLETECLRAVTNWIEPSDRILHIFEDEPRIDLGTVNTTTCRYDCIDIDSPENPAEADVVETPWNIGSRFATGVFDVVVLDIPYSAFQRNIRTPHAEATGKSDHTHIDTALKRSLTDLIAGDGGRVIQIGRTATAMSNNDYSYYRIGTTIIQHPACDADRLVTVDEKPHENLEVASLGDGEVDGYIQHPAQVDGLSSKHNRTDHEPSIDSDFCVHCGNHYFHHKAMYVYCPDCGAAPMNLCMGPDGKPREPTGSDQRVTEHDVCAERLEKAAEEHSGDCNNKTPSYIEADSDRVQEILDTLPPQDEIGPVGYIQKLRIEQYIEQNYVESPRSTNIKEIIIDYIVGSSEITIGEKEINTDINTETATLEDFL